jgi:hypothetical protein
MQKLTDKQRIKAMGGPAAVAKLCECSCAAVSKWYGHDKYGKARQIPKVRKMYLRTMRPDLFPIT